VRDAQGRKIPWGAVELAHQVAALPYRSASATVPEILLITSRDTRRWVIPKGWPMKNRTPAEAAAREAQEEAGVIGEIAAEPFGTYRYQKVLKHGGSILCEVAVFPLRVVSSLDSWHEQHQRELRWFVADEAAGLVAEDDLAALIRLFATEPPQEGSSS
jgi:8-oxo-dGTP pyrophosphatase MutT (NUDIX family)